jgi:hypothetical protein
LDGRGDGIGVLDLGHEAGGSRPHSLSSTAGSVDPGVGRAASCGSADGEMEVAWPPDPEVADAGTRGGGGVGGGPLCFWLWLVRALPRSGDDAISWSETTAGDAATSMSYRFSSKWHSLMSDSVTLP